MILSTVIFLPLLGALLLLLIPKEEEGLLRGISLLFATATFAISLLLLRGFDADGWNQVVNLPWVPSLGIGYHFGIDGISLYLVLLTTFLMPIVPVSAWQSVSRKVREFVVCMLILETG